MSSFIISLSTVCTTISSLIDMSTISGIVGMLLLPRDHPFRRFVDTMIWGGADRGTVALWVLATLVQFGVGRSAALGRAVSIILAESCACICPLKTTCVGSFMKERGGRSDLLFVPS